MGLMYYKPLDGSDPIPIASGPRGAQGEQGPTGPIGPEGPIGKQGGAIGFAQFKYRYSTSTDETPSAGQIQSDNSDPALVTHVHIHERADDGENVSMFLDELEVGDWFNAFAEADETNARRFDVTGPPTKSGNVYTVPIRLFSSTGPGLANNQRMDLYLRYVTPPQHPYWDGTQAEYDALGNYDPTTTYYVRED